MVTRRGRWQKRRRHGQVRDPGNWLTWIAKGINRLGFPTPNLSPSFHIVSFQPFVHGLRVLKASGSNFGLITNFKVPYVAPMSLPRAHCVAQNGARKGIKKIHKDRSTHVRPQSRKIQTAPMVQGYLWRWKLITRTGGRRLRLAEDGAAPLEGLEMTKCVSMFSSPMRRSDLYSLLADVQGRLNVIL